VETPNPAADAAAPSAPEPLTSGGGEFSGGVPTGPGHENQVNGGNMVSNGDDANEEDDLNDVMEVLTDLTREDYKNASARSPNGAGDVEALTTVQDVAKVVDKMEVVEEELSPAALAQQKFVKVNDRQQALEKRLYNLANKINLIRCRKFGSHIVKEISHVRSSYEKYLPPPPHSMPAIGSLVPPAQLATLQPPPTPSPVAGGHLVPQQPQPRQLLGPAAPPPPFSPLVSLSAAFQQQQQQQQGQLGGGSMPTLPNMPVVPPQLQLQSLQPGLTPQLPTHPLGQFPLATAEPDVSAAPVVKEEPNPLLQSLQHQPDDQHHFGSQAGQPKRKIKKSKKLLLAEAAAAEAAAAAKAEAAIPPAPSEENKQQFNETLGKLNVNLRHLIQSYDSEATESSSGGESCDEFEGFDPESVKTVPLRKRAKYSWLKNRAGIASRWTWLTAQIADLEYRIRQQTELYRQIRSMKGPLFLGEPPRSATPAAVPTANRQSVFTLTAAGAATDEGGGSGGSGGTRLVVKGPADPVPEPEEAVCARTRPVKSIKKRCVMTTAGFYRVSARAAKESNVSCGCLRPHFTCAICYGRSNHALAPDPVFHDRAKTMALLDHSYHQVLSRPSTDVPVEVVLSKKLKNRSWMLEGGAISSQPEGPSGPELVAPSAGGSAGGGGGDKAKGIDKTAKEGPRVLSKYMRKKLEERRRQKMLMGEDGADVEEEYFLSKLKKKKLKSKDGGGGVGKSSSATKKRKKSVTVSHHSGDGVAINDIHEYDEAEEGESRQPSTSTNTPAAHQSVVATPNSHLATMEQIRRKRGTSFDIDNIVIPYSTMASARVEKLKYKEIQTPYWREVEGSQHVVIPALTPSQPKSETEEDISELNYIVRHKKS